MNAFGLYRLLDSCRRRLNLIIICCEMVKYIGFFAVGAGVFGVVLRLLGYHWVNGLFWGTFVLLGAIVGLLLGTLHRTDRFETARWLDWRFKTQGAFSAALDCLELKTDHPFASLLLFRAERLVKEVQKIPWPTRYLKQWTGIALGLLLASGLFMQMGLANQKDVRLVKAPVNTGKTAPQNNPLKQETVQPGLPSQQVAKTFAPNNPKMAKKIEQALQSGDSALLQRLLNEAQQEMDGSKGRIKPGEVDPAQINPNLKGFMLPSSQSSDSKQKNPQVNAGHSTKGQGSNRQYGAQTDEKPRSGGRKKDPKGDKEPDMDGDKERRSSGDNDRTNQRTPNNSGNQGQQQPGKGDGERSKHSDQLPPNFGGKKVVLNQQKEGELFEYVLPGKDATVPLSEIVTDAQLSAEAAMERLGIPGEYSDFVRYYFLELSQSVGSKGQEGEE